MERKETWIGCSGTPTRDIRVVSMRARIWKCITDRLRLAAADEEASADLISQDEVAVGVARRTALTRRNRNKSLLDALIPLTHQWLDTGFLSSHPFL